MIRQTAIPDAQQIHGTIEASEVTTGDIVFCARPSPLQDLFTRAGEPWRHVGMAIVVDGVPSIIEVSGPKFDVRPIAAVLDSATAAAIARFGFEGRPYAAKAANWCFEHAHQEQTYAWDDVILAGFIAVTRRFSLPHDQPRLERVVDAAVSTLAAHQTNRVQTQQAAANSYSCSAFVVAAFQEVGYPIDFDLSLPRAEDVRPSLWEIARAGERPLRSAHGSRISATQSAGLARSLITGLMAAQQCATKPNSNIDRSRWHRWASPGDIWRSSSEMERLELLV